MRVTIQDKVSHNFIEGPIQMPSANVNELKGVNEGFAKLTDLTNEDGVKSDPTDIDIPYYEVGAS